MISKPEDFFLLAWKQHLDASLRMAQTVIDGAIRIRELQLQAAADAHADAEATRKSIAAASDPVQVLRLQAEWTRANVEKCAAYWRSMFQALADTQGALVSCLGTPAPAAVPGADPDSRRALLGLIDNAYQQWLDSTQQFYKLPAIPAQASTQRRAAA